MELLNYISNDKITVSNQKTVSEIIEQYAEISYSHLPVVHKGILIGNIDKEDLLSIDNPDQKLINLEYLYEFFFAKKTDTLLELFSKYALNNSTILPVVDDNNSYLGYLDFNDLLGCFADTHFLSAEGSILLIEKNNKDISMSEICQIVESNNNSVLGMFVYHQDQETTSVLLKTKSIQINEIIQSFRRYEYEILNDLTEDTYLDSLKKRSEYFIKYLNI